MLQDLRFSEWCCCKFKSSGIPCCVTGCVVTNIFKNVVLSSSGSGNPRRLLDPEGDGTALLVYVNNYWPSGTMSHPRRGDSLTMQVKFGTEMCHKHSSLFEMKCCL